MPNRISSPLELKKKKKGKKKNLTSLSLKHIRLLGILHTRYKKRDKAAYMAYYLFIHQPSV